MAAPAFKRAEVISLKDNSNYNEAWVRDRIAEDPSILGLGDVELRAVEKIQPKAGRLDLLLHDDEAGIRYEVELMLGEVDPSHIIRALEYWDIERKRYPRYEHRAVLVAEKINSRFLNVIGLFNSTVPIIAIQMAALQLGDNVTLHFTTVLDVIEAAEEESETQSGVYTREHWVQRASEATVVLAEKCGSLLSGIAPGAMQTYRKQFIGVAINGIVNNFVIFQPTKQFLVVKLRVPDREDWRDRLDKAGLDVDLGKTRLHLRFTPDHFDGQQAALLQEVIKAAFDDAV